MGMGIHIAAYRVYIEAKYLNRIPEKTNSLCVGDTEISIS